MLGFEGQRITATPAFHRLRKTIISTVHGCCCCYFKCRQVQGSQKATLSATSARSRVIRAKGGVIQLSCWVWGQSSSSKGADRFLSGISTLSS